MKMLCAGLLVGGCTTPPAIPAHAPDLAASAAWIAANNFAGASEQGAWEHFVLPNKRPTQFSAQRERGRDAMQAQSQASASILRRKLRVSPEQLGTMQFAWLVDAHIPGADLAQSAADDSPVRVVMAFEGDRSNFSMRNAVLSELAQTVTGEPLPYATLMYAWCLHCTVGQVIVNPRTDRIRTLVVEAGSDNLGQWRDYRRDVAADFAAVFGEAPGALVTVGIMTDSDNTAGHATAWYGPLALVSRAAPVPR